jgi:hypothetical protein
MPYHTIDRANVDSMRALSKRNIYNPLIKNKESLKNIHVDKKVATLAIFG